MKALAIAALVACGGKEPGLPPSRPAPAGDELSPATRKLLADTHAKVEIHAFLTPGHPKLDALTPKVRHVLAQYATTGVRVELHDPVDATFAKERFGIGPTPFRLADRVVEGYFAIAVQVGDRKEVLGLDDLLRAHSADEIVVDDLEYKLDAAIRGARPTVALWVPQGLDLSDFGLGAPGTHDAPDQQFEQLSASLASASTGPAGPIAPEVTALVIAGPSDLDAKAVAEIDAFVMRGGALVVLDGHHRLSKSGMRAVSTGIDDALGAYGIRIGREIVLDRRSIELPTSSTAGFQPNPYFLALRGGLARHHISGDLDGLVLPFSSPVLSGGAELVRSSSQAWLTDSTNFENPPRPDTIPVGQLGSRILAVAARGPFTSATGSGKRSPASARIVVIGSSEFASDAFLEALRSLNRPVDDNLALVKRAVAWATADEQLVDVPFSTIR